MYARGPQERDKEQTSEGLPRSVRTASSRVLVPRPVFPVASPRADAFESKVDVVEPSDGGGQIVDESVNPTDERLEARVGGFDGCMVLDVSNE